MSDALLQVFNFNGSNVRIEMVIGEPWFVAADVCNAIGIGNPTEALRRLEDDEKSTLRISEGGPERNIVSEAGLYSLILCSNKPEAREFKRWITHEVLPSIRKHGIYATPATIESMIANPDFGIQLLNTLKIEREQRALAEIQRDRALATKAQIGARREASAMATASAAVRRAAVLEEQLGISEEWKAVKSIEWLPAVFNFETSKALYSLIGKALRKKSEAMRFQVREIPSQEYGHILTFHRDVIAAFRDDLTADPFFMAKYRLMEN